MGKYLKKFSTDSDRIEYEGSNDYLEPYVSLVEENNSVHYNKVETRVVAKYNVTSTSNPTPIGFNQFISAFTEIEIDGVVQPTVVSAYTFDTLGEHTVKYTLSDPTSIGQGAFCNCIGLTSVTIPNSVTSIGDGAFSSCGSLTSIEIPSGVTSIGEGVFGSCSSLTSVTIPNSVTSIGQNAFRNCSGLTDVTIGSGVTSIGDYAFYNCGSLTSVTIPNSVTSIGQNAFGGCGGLTSITIPNNVTSIGGSAFSYCSGLTSVTIPNNVTSIGTSAFINCSKLKSVTVEATTPPTLGSAAFYGLPITYGIYVPSESVNAYETANGWSDYASSIQPIPTT